MRYIHGNCCSTPPSVLDSLLTHRQQKQETLLKLFLTSREGQSLCLSQATLPHLDLHPRRVLLLLRQLPEHLCQGRQDHSLGHRLANHLQVGALALNQQHPLGLRLLQVKDRMLHLLYNHCKYSYSISSFYHCSMLSYW